MVRLTWWQHARGTLTLLYRLWPTKGGRYGRTNKRKPWAGGPATDSSALDPRTLRLRWVDLYRRCELSPLVWNSGNALVPLPVRCLLRRARPVLGWYVGLQSPRRAGHRHARYVGRFLDGLGPLAPPVRHGSVEDNRS